MCSHAWEYPELDALLWYKQLRARSLVTIALKPNPTDLGFNMDIVAIRQQLSQHGLHMETSDINGLLIQLKGAIADKSIKRAIAPDGSHLYPIKHIIKFLVGKNNYTGIWHKAIEHCPVLASFQTIVSYSKYPTVKEEQGILSLSLYGVIYLAAFLEFKTTEPTVLKLNLDDNKEVSKQPNESVVIVSNCHIYVLKDVANKALKIGFTADTDRRVAQHKASNPFLVPLAFYPVTSMSIEKQLHEALNTYRIQGTREWYRNTPELRQAIFNFFFED